MRRAVIYTLVFFIGFTIGILGKGSTGTVVIGENTSSIISREQKRQKYDHLLYDVRKCGKYVCK
jgi:hypothetical protein